MDLVSSLKDDLVDDEEWPPERVEEVRKWVRQNASSDSWGSDWVYSNRRSMQEILPGLFLGPLAAATKKNVSSRRRCHWEAPVKMSFLFFSLYVYTYSFPASCRRA